MQQMAPNDNACRTTMMKQRATGAAKRPGMKKAHELMLVSTPPAPCHT